MYTVLLSSGCWVYGKGEFLQDSSNHKRYLNSYMFLYSTEDKIPKEVNSSITGYTNDCELTAFIWLTDGQTLYSTLYNNVHSHTAEFTIQCTWFGLF